MKLLSVIKQLFLRREGRPAKGATTQLASTLHAESTTVETPPSCEPAIQPQSALAVVEEQLSNATDEFRRTLDAGTATAIGNYKRLRDAAESQQDEHLRSSLMAYADNQLIQSIRWLLDSDDQFTTAITTPHEQS
jgi:hypothetical protein